VLEELDVRTTHLDRDSWSIPESFKTRKRPFLWRQRFHNKDPVINAKANPCVSLAVSASPADNKTSFIPEIHELLPRPQSEVVAISSAGSLELLRRHPVVFKPELFLIGKVPAGLQEGANLFYVPAGDLQRLAQEGTHRASFKRGVSLLPRPRYALAVEIVESFQDFRDHDESRRSAIWSRLAMN
jgi:hypothetical protein